MTIRYSVEEIWKRANEQDAACRETSRVQESRDGDGYTYSAWKPHEVRDFRRLQHESNRWMVKKSLRERAGDARLDRFLERRGLTPEQVARDLSLHHFFGERLRTLVRVELEEELGPPVEGKVDVAGRDFVCLNPILGRIVLPYRFIRNARTSYPKAEGHALHGALIYDPKDRDGLIHRFGELVSCNHEAACALCDVNLRYFLRQRLGNAIVVDVRRRDGVADVAGQLTEVSKGSLRLRTGRGRHEEIDMPEVVRIRFMTKLAYRLNKLKGS